MAGAGDPLGRTPLEEFASGLARGTLLWSAQTVRYYAELLLNRKLAFVGRRDYVEEIRSERRSPEYLFYRDYITDKDLRLLAQLGLTLREWEADPARKKDLHDLRGRMRKKFGEDGLHIAEVVQSRILTGVIPVALVNSEDKEQTATRIEEFLRASRIVCIFIQESDIPEVRAQEVSTRLVAHDPPLFVLFARGSALKTLETVVLKTLELTTRYTMQVHDLFRSRIVILVRTDLTGDR